jgi:DNA adenine methylase
VEPRVQMRPKLAAMKSARLNENALGSSSEGGRCSRTPEVRLSRHSGFYKSSKAEYREPFVGGGAVALALLSHGQSGVWLNDLDCSTIAAWLAVQRHPEQLQLAIQTFRPSVHRFELSRSDMLNAATVPKRPTDLVHLALCTFVVRQLAFGSVAVSGGSPRGGFFQSGEDVARRWPVSRLCKRIDLVSPLLRGARITNIDFEEVIAAPRSALVYIDPPYVKAGQELYKHYFTEGDHDRLARLLRNSIHDWVLSYDDHPIIWSNYGSFCRISRIPTRYSVGPGRVVHELLISPCSPNHLAGN